MDFKKIFVHYVFAGRNGLKSNFCSILLSRLNMVIYYIDNVLDYKIP